MSNLTNRLRGIYKVGNKAEFGTRSFADFIPPISIEAADRIDELESMLEETRLVMENQNLQSDDKDANNLISQINIMLDDSL